MILKAAFLALPEYFMRHQGKVYGQQSQRKSLYSFMTAGERVGHRLCH